MKMWDISKSIKLQYTLSSHTKRSITGPHACAWFDDVLQCNLREMGR